MVGMPTAPLQTTFITRVLWSEGTPLGLIPAGWVLVTYCLHCHTQLSFERDELLEHAEVCHA